MSNFLVVIMLLALAIMIYFIIKKKWKQGGICLAIAAVCFVIVGILPNDKVRNKEKQASLSSTTLATKKDKTKTSSKTSDKSKTTKASSSTEQKVIEITPDQLVEKTNNGSLKSGEKYHFVGEMMRADNWNTGSSGKFTVYVKAPSQSPIAGMMLYADESDADNWTDGTQVDFTVNIEDVNVGGEKITNPVVKSSKIISGGTSKEAKKTAIENNFYSAMTSAAQTVNNNLGSTAIDSIDKGYIYPAVDVQLNIVFASYTNMEIKSLVQTLNENLVKVAIDNGEANPQIKYYISGVSIGENRSILNPSEVKFNSNLK